MMNFKSLTPLEQESMLKFPAYISLLAANNDGILDPAEKLSAIEFNHVQTYSCNPVLAEFFHDVDGNSKTTIEQLNKALPLGKLNRDVAIKKKLLELDTIVGKLGQDYSSIMHISMQSFKDHISLAYHNVLIDFIFPIPIKGLSY